METIQNDYYEDEIDLLDLIKVLWKKRILIIVLTFICTITGVFFALTRTSIYKAQLTFIEESEDSSSSLASSLAGALPLGLGSNLNSDSSSLLIILESRTFREELIEKLGLYDYYIEYNEIELEKIEVKEDIPTIYDVAAWLKGIVIVSKDEKNSVYRVEVQLKHKEMVAKIANEYFNVLDNYLKNEKLYKSKISKKYLGDQVGSIENQIDDQQKKIRLLEEKYNTVSILDEAKIVTETVVGLKQEIIQGESELKIISAFAGERSLELRRKKETLQVLKDQLSAITEGKGDLPIEIIPLNKIPKIKFEMQKLQQELEVNLEVYKMLRVQYEQKKLDEINNQSLITILDSAIEPKTPIKPNKKLIVMIACVLGGFLGVFLAFVLEFIKNIDWKKITD